MMSYRPLIIAAIALATTGGWSSAQTRTGMVELDGHALRDDGGHFLGLGASYFQALRRTKYDIARFRGDLAFLQRGGINYIRTLSMVGWYAAWDGREIAPVTFVNREGKRIDAWPDYWEQLARMIDIAFDEFGIRTQITIFADAQLIPKKADRIAHMDRVLRTIRGREQKVILLEVANEGWQNGFPGEQGVADLREFGAYLGRLTDVLVALSATEGPDHAALARMYVGSAADIATEHFSRDTRTIEGAWLPIRDPYRVNTIDGLPPASSNEPIGPGSSVAQQDDPIMLVCGAAYTWMSGLPMYVYHTNAGVFGVDRFEDMAGAYDAKHLLSILPGDIANWKRTEGRDDFAPFTTFANGQPNKPWTEVEKPKTGALRHLSCTKGNAFYTLPIGILAEGVELEAKRAMAIEVLNPLTGEAVREMSLNARQRFTLPQGPKAYLIRGRWLDRVPLTPSPTGRGQG